MTTKFICYIRLDFKNIKMRFKLKKTYFIKEIIYFFQFQVCWLKKLLYVLHWNIYTHWRDDHALDKHMYNS